MKKMMATLLVSLVMVFAACSISSACFLVFYQPQLPEKE